MPGSSRSRSVRYLDSVRYLYGFSRTLLHLTLIPPAWCTSPARRACSAGQRLPTFFAGNQFRVVDKKFQQTGTDVEPDLIAVTNKRDGSAVHSLRRDVPDAQAGGSAGESSVGQQQDVFTQAGAL